MSRNRYHQMRHYGSPPLGAAQAPSKKFFATDNPLWMFVMIGGLFVLFAKWDDRRMAKKGIR